MIIDEDQLSSYYNNSNIFKIKTTTKTTPLPPNNNNTPKQLLLKDSSYLSIGYSDITIPQIAEIASVIGRCKSLAN